MTLEPVELSVLHPQPGLDRLTALLQLHDCSSTAESPDAETSMTILLRADWATPRHWLASDVRLPPRGCQTLTRGPAARGAEWAESCRRSRRRRYSTRGAAGARVHEARSHSRVRQPMDRIRLRYHAELPLGIQHAAALARPCCCAEALVHFECQLRNQLEQNL